MMKRKLELDSIKIKSFVTTIDYKQQKILVGGSETCPKQSRVLACPTQAEPFECKRTDEEECEDLITDDPNICDGLLN